MPSKIKSPADIKAKLRDVLHKAMQRYIEKRLAPCPENCKHAPVIGNKVQQCPTCLANPGQPCRIRLRFEQRRTYEALRDEFRDRARNNREWLIREYPEARILLWVMGDLDTSQEPDPEPLPDYLRDDRTTDVPAWMHLDGNTLVLSPEVTALFAGFLERLADRQPPTAPSS